MAPTLSRRLSAAIAATVLATSLVALALAPASAFPGIPADDQAATLLDDRDLERSKGKKKWKKVSSGKAYEDTLLRTRKKKATAETKVPATDGGSVTFQAGPKRGKFVVTAGDEKTKVKTSSKSVKFKTVDFTGAGPVKLKVTKPGRKGVYLDAIALVDPTTPPEPPTPEPTAPPAENCASGTSDGGTLTSASGTPLRVCQLPGRATSNLVMPRLTNIVYALSGPMEVGNDVGGGGALPGGNAVTLTVEPGVVVIADDATDALLVNRGSRINAIGTAAQPIVFTSRSNLEGTATEGTEGLWGGITLLGRAPISDCNTAVPGGSVDCQRTLPNFTANYGGNVPTDTSGTLSHVQVRFAGAGAEGAGLRAAGVGNATALDHIQVLGSGGDGLSAFGGRVSLGSLALTGAADDVVATDFGYRGTIQYLVGVQSGAGSGDALIVADSNGNEDALPRQYTRVSNASLIGRSTAGGGNMVLLRGGTDFALLNSVVTGPTSCLDIDATGGTTTRPADNALQDLGPPVFRSVGLACPTAFTDDGNVTAATISGIFGSGTNSNNSAHSASFSGLVNGPNETAIGATNPTPFNADTFGTAAAGSNALGATAFAAAIQNASDTRFQGWTCDTGFASFGSGVNCVTSPI